MIRSVTSRLVTCSRVPITFTRQAHTATCTGIFIHTRTPIWTRACASTHPTLTYTSHRYAATSTSTSTSTSTPSTSFPPHAGTQEAVQEAIEASKQSTTDEFKVHPRSADGGAIAHTVKSAISTPSIDTQDSYVFPHPIWKEEYAFHGVEITHKQPKDWVDTAAYYMIKTIRFNFDWISGYSLFKRTPAIWINRIVFLETIAGIPGSIAGTLRHLASLRRLRRDHGWIHTLLEEAENERMHLLTFMSMKPAGPLFKAAVFISQGIFFNFFWVAYLISPRFCHRLVGYLEEEATKTYTKLLHDIDTPSSPVAHWGTTPAPRIARVYWKLKDNATIRDVVAQVRADEAHHRDVNHTFANLTQTQASPNPFRPGQ